jgi:hypothetical protein
MDERIRKPKPGEGPRIESIPPPMKNVPLLQIELADINSVPMVYYKGEKIDKKIRVSFDYMTDTHEQVDPTYIHIERHDDEGKVDTKIVQHNHPIIDKECVAVYADGRLVEVMSDD